MKQFDKLVFRDEFQRIIKEKHPRERYLKAARLFDSIHDCYLEQFKALQKKVAVEEERADILKELSEIKALLRIVVEDKENGRKFSKS